ncbi:hypothetical protein P078_0063 [Lactococcus phage P078]|uniref:Uncharacterized protein n=1 Tax=Lactococcus phage P078 TaxID=1476886 RepID=X4Y7N0_9CAUD|nr:hypothetical protein GJ21_gp63 [Lactococcus phage P078]AHV83026.1 hypothetical protein P078_0063 [Lactococcus phage P078]
MPDNSAYHNHETEMAEVNISTYRGNTFNLDPGVEYLCFNRMHPEHDYRVMKITRSTRLCYIMDMFDKIKAYPTDVFSEYNRELLDSDRMRVVINLSNNKYSIMSTDTFRLSYELLPPTYEKFDPRSYNGRKVKVFNPSRLETGEIVVLSRGLDLVNVLATTIEDSPTHYKRTARVLSHKDIYKQFAQGKTIGVSYDSGVITYYREDAMSRFYVIKGEEK